MVFQKGRVLAQDDLNEFVFRFNRRRSRRRGMVFYRVLELAVAHDPVRYQDLIATKGPRAVLPTPPQARGHHRAWSTLQRTAPGELRAWTRPVKWIPQTAEIAFVTFNSR